MSRSGLWQWLRRLGASWRSFVPSICAMVALAIAVLPMASTRLIPLEQQPFPDAMVYADTGYEIANGNGFETVVADNAAVGQPGDGVLRPSRYPPGF